MHIYVFAPQRETNTRFDSLSVSLSSAFREEWLRGCAPLRRLRRFGRGRGESGGGATRSVLVLACIAQDVGRPGVAATPVDSTRLDSVVVCSAPHRSWPREEDGRAFVTLCSPFERTRLLRSSFALRDSRAIIRERYIRESDSFAFQFDPTRIDRAVKYTLRIHEGGNEGGRRWRL